VVFIELEESRIGSELGQRPNSLDEF
jgi:hypothetical protein